MSFDPRTCLAAARDAQGIQDRLDELQQLTLARWEKMADLVLAVRACLPQMQLGIHAKPVPAAQRRRLFLDRLVHLIRSARESGYGPGVDRILESDSADDTPSRRLAIAVTRLADQSQTKDALRVLKQVEELPVLSPALASPYQSSAAFWKEIALLLEIIVPGQGALPIIPKYAIPAEAGELLASLAGVSPEPENSSAAAGTPIVAAPAPIAQPIGQADPGPAQLSQPGGTSEAGRCTAVPGSQPTALEEGEVAGSIRASEAALLTGLNPGIISRAADAKQFKTNGLKHQHRRLDVVDFTRWFNSRERKQNRPESNASVQRLMDMAQARK